MQRELALDFVLSCIGTPRHNLPSTWSNLAPVMFGLVKTFRPRTYLELGVHHGFSFFCACQAAAEANIPLKATAIDTWRGDSQAGVYEEDVFESFQAICKTDYANIASFLRMDFNSAVNEIEDESIDLLHIDGYHSLEAVTTDYENYLPKMSKHGAMMFHDINVHVNDFGVWKFWSELQANHPGQTFGLNHGYGLGIFVPTKAIDSPIGQCISHLAANPGDALFVQRFLAKMGEWVKSNT